MADDEKAGSAQGSRVGETVELIKRLCLALTNVQMFSVDHPLARQNVASAYEWLRGMLDRQGEAVAFNVAGPQLLLGGMRLEDQNPAVARLASRLGELHITSLVFQPAVTPEEFSDFYALLGLGPKRVNEGGGIEPLMAARGITGISTAEVRYVRLREDQKVVSADAKVEASGTAPAGAENIVRQVASQVMDRAEQQRWLLTEMKHDPEKMATMIADGIDLAVSRAEMGSSDARGAVEALLDNVRLIGQRLLTEETDSDAQETEGMEKAILRLEQEMRLRGGKLMSSKVATGFINEVMSLVASYSDRINSRRLADEFVRGEGNLRRAEKLLRDMTPKTESTDQFLGRVREHLERKGVRPEQVDALAERVKAAPPRAPRKRRPPAQAVAEGIEKRVEFLNLGEEQTAELVERLGSFVEARARERGEELRARAEALEVRLADREAVMNGVPLGIVILDAAGGLSYANPAAREIGGLGEGFILKPGVRAVLETRAMPLAGIQELKDTAGLDVSDVRLLLAVAAVVKDAAGALKGLLLKRRG